MLHWDDDQHASCSGRNTSSPKETVMFIFFEFKVNIYILNRGNASELPRGTNNINSKQLHKYRNALALVAMFAGHPSCKTCSETKYKVRKFCHIKKQVRNVQGSCRYIGVPSLLRRTTSPALSQVSLSLDLFHS